MTALIVQVSMGGVPGVRCPIVVSLVPSRVSPQVVGRIDRGCLLFLRVISSLVLFWTIVVCVSRF